MKLTPPVGDFKTSATRLINTLYKLDKVTNDQVTLYNDNLALIKFINGEGTAKGIRHVELRMYYVREKYLEGNIALQYMSGETLPVDQMTKIGSKAKFLNFRDKIMGLGLLSDEEKKIYTDNEVEEEIHHDE